ncbi:hypothetical protein CYMTET_16297 [Cymbomonas tetramitiformis]|uniref:Uncharacterized protein n=1 Tax=Cymbomonas tetramitiformis TaxID=36881 RepID=A0AAE0L8E6_9CHLO|nr:hypothetical protein CYMTET_16297 [Cymbomonas tetramitiformis]
MAVFNLDRNDPTVEVILKLVKLSKANIPFILRYPAKVDGCSWRKSKTWCVTIEGLTGAPPRPTCKQQLYDPLDPNFYDTAEVLYPMPSDLSIITIKVLANLVTNIYVALQQQQCQRATTPADQGAAGGNALSAAAVDTDQSETTFQVFARMTFQRLTKIEDYLKEMRGRMVPPPGPPKFARGKGIIGLPMYWFHYDGVSARFALACAEYGALAVLTLAGDAAAFGVSAYGITVGGDGINYANNVSLLRGVHHVHASVRKAGERYGVHFGHVAFSHEAVGGISVGLTSVVPTGGAASGGASAGGAAGVPTMMPKDAVLGPAALSAGGDRACAEPVLLWVPAEQSAGHVCIDTSTDEFLAGVEPWRQLECGAPPLGFSMGGLALATVCMLLCACFASVGVVAVDNLGNLFLYFRTDADRQRRHQRYNG